MKPIKTVIDWTDPVPCNGCYACCIADTICLTKDELSKFKHEAAPGTRTGFIVPHKENGWCLYLTEQGCSVHNDKPQVCREMDCRMIAHYIPKRAIIGQPYRVKKVWQRGRQLLRCKVEQ